MKDASEEYLRMAIVFYFMQHGSKLDMTKLKKEVNGLISCIDDAIQGYNDADTEYRIAKIKERMGPLEKRTSNHCN